MEGAGRRPVGPPERGLRSLLKPVVDPGPGYDELVRGSKGGETSEECGHRCSGLQGSRAFPDVPIAPVAGGEEELVCQSYQIPRIGAGSTPREVVHQPGPAGAAVARPQLNAIAVLAGEEQGRAESRDLERVVLDRVGPGWRGGAPAGCRRRAGARPTREGALGERVIDPGDEEGRAEKQRWLLGETAAGAQTDVLDQRRTRRRTVASP